MDSGSILLRKKKGKKKTNDGSLYTLNNFFAAIRLRVGRESNMDGHQGREGEVN